MSYASVITADSPLSWYRMGDTNATLHDSSGNAFDGTYTGTPGVDYTQATGGLVGDADKAVLFQGTNAGCAQYTYGVTVGTGDFSVELWANPAASGTLVLWSTGSFWLGVVSGTLTLSGATGGALTHQTALATGTRYHVVLARASGVMTLYLNAVACSSTQTDTTSLVGSLMQTVAGLGGASFEFNGTIDEVAFYAGANALDQTKITAHYNAGTTVAFNVSVRDAPYLAAGDGVTDDTAAIQAALDAVPDGGGTVFVPAGVYRFSSTIAISKNGTTFTGVGPGSVLRPTDGVHIQGIGIPSAYNAVIDPHTVVSNVTVSGLTVDGNHGGFQPGDVINGYAGIYVGQASHATLTGLVVENWSADGISVANGNTANDHVTVSKCLVRGNYRNGIHVGFATNTTVEQNYCIDNPSQWWGGSAGNSLDIEVEGYDELGPGPRYPYVTGLLVRDNVFRRVASGTGGDGIAVQPAYGYVSGVTVSKNVIHGHQNAVATTGVLGGYGQVSSVNLLTVEDNWIGVDPALAVLGFPMALEGVANTTVSGNSMNDQSPYGYFSGGGTYGMIDVGTSSNVLIENNLARGFSIALVTIDGGDTVAVTGNSHDAPAVTATRGTAGTNVTASGNTDVSASPRDLTPPTASFDITSGTTITSPTDLTVTAADAGAGVARVFFFVDGVPAGFSDTAPHVFTFDPGAYAAGEHILSCLAVDGAANLSAESSVTVNPPSPVLFLTVPGGNVLMLTS